jgi:TolA-binding protein
LERCAACRLERQMRADFAREMQGEDPRISVSGLLALAGVAKPPVVEEAVEELAVAGLPRRAGAARRRLTRATWLLAAAAVFAASAAGAAGATGIGQRAWSRLVGASEPATVLAASEPRPAPKRAPRHALAALAPVSAPAPVETRDVLASEPAPVKARVAAPSPRAVVTAASVFEAANEARRHGDYTRSLSLHRELESRFPTSREAHVSRATTGQLLLDLGDPAGALASFDAYLATGSGELGGEAMVGRATALERMGRADDARRAWQALLAAFPDSPYAAHAKRRLASR